MKGGKSKSEWEKRVYGIDQGRKINENETVPFLLWGVWTGT